MLNQDGASGVLKLNSKMLQPAELRKLDKLDMCLMVEGVREGKGETVLLLYPPPVQTVANITHFIWFEKL